MRVCWAGGSWAGKNTYSGTGQERKVKTYQVGIEQKEVGTEPASALTDARLRIRLVPKMPHSSCIQPPLTCGRLTGRVGAPALPASRESPPGSSSGSSHACPRGCCRRSASVPQARGGCEQDAGSRVMWSKMHSKVGNTNTGGAPATSMRASCQRELQQAPVQLHSPVGPAAVPVAYVLGPANLRAV